MSQSSTGSNFPNCSAEYTTIVPDPDIDGLGVLISFVVSSGLTLLASVLACLVDTLPEKHASHASQSSQRPPREGTGTSIGISKERRDYFFTMLERFVLGLADQQLLTSITILTVGYIKYDITVFHFSIVGDLAWLSAGTHLTAASVITGYLRKYRAARLWRTFLMFCIYILLMTSTVLTANDHWRHNLACPARCLFKNTVGSVRNTATITWLVFDLALLTYGYALTVISFSPTLSHHTDEWLGKGWNALKSLVQLLPISPRVLKSATLKKYFRTTKTAFDLGLDLFWLAFWVLRVFSDRAQINAYKDTSRTSFQTWGFGQLVPLFLIALPFLTALEIFCGTYCRVTKFTKFLRRGR